MLKSAEQGRCINGGWKTMIGPKLKARSFANHQTEAKIGARVLNRRTKLGHPNFERIA